MTRCSARVRSSQDGRKIHPAYLAEVKSRGNRRRPTTTTRSAQRSRPTRLLRPLNEGGCELVEGLSRPTVACGAGLCSAAPPFLLDHGECDV